MTQPATTSSSPTGTGDVLVVLDGPVGIVTINRPERLNAVTPATGERLSEAFRGLDADPEIRSVVLTGAGRAFCVGADISGDIGNARDVLRKTWNPLIQTMQDPSRCRSSRR